MISAPQAAGEHIEHDPTGGQTQQIELSHRPSQQGHKASHHGDMPLDAADEIFIGHWLKVVDLIGVAFGNQLPFHGVVVHYAVRDHIAFALEKGDDFTLLNQFRLYVLDVDHTAHRDLGLHAAGEHLKHLVAQQPGHCQRRADSDHGQKNQCSKNAAKGGKKFPALGFAGLRCRQSCRIRFHILHHAVSFCGRKADTNRSAQPDRRAAAHR